MSWEHGKCHARVRDLLPHGGDWTSSAVRTSVLAALGFVSIGRIPNTPQIPVQAVGSINNIEYG